MNGAAAGPAQVRIDADLAVEIDGLAAQVTGHGDVVRVLADRPLALLRHASTGSVPLVVKDSVPEWGRRLAEQGVRLELWSPRGLMGTFGAPSDVAAPRRIGRYWHVEPGPADVVVAEVVREVGVVARQRRNVVVTVLVVVAFAAGARTIRRHMRGS